MQDNDNAPSADPAPPSGDDAPERRGVPRASRRSRAIAYLWEWTKVFWFSVALFLVIRTFFVEAFKIPSGSMENTLLIGDFLLVNKLAYGAEVPFTHARLPGLRQPRHGDVIVFDFPLDPTKNFVKRLVGLPGDTLAMHDGVLMRNGVPVREGYVSHTEPDTDPSSEEFTWQRDFLVKSARASVGYHPSRDNWGPLVVTARHYFVLGDNRDNSSDSRYWGFVPDSMVTGSPVVIYYSYDPDTTKELAWLTHIRWKRLGERIR